MSGSISVLATFADPDLEKTIRSGLADVEAMLHDSVRSDYPFVDETSRHLLDAGGKRFRPLVVLLAAALRRPGVDTPWSRPRSRSS